MEQTISDNQKRKVKQTIRDGESIELWDGNRDN